MKILKIHNGDINSLSRLENECFELDHLLGTVYINEEIKSIPNSKKLPKIVHDKLIIVDNILENFNNFPEKVVNLFNVRNNNISCLKNIPKCEEDIYLNSNSIKSFKYIQKHVKGSLIARDNKLTSLKYCPYKIDNTLDLSNNMLTSTKHISKYAHQVNLKNNDLTCVEFLPENKIEILNINYNNILEFKYLHKYDIKYVQFSSNVKNLMNTSLSYMGTISNKSKNLEHQINFSKYLFENNIVIDRTDENTYYQSLLDYSIKNNVNVIEIDWPENFLSENIKKNNKTSNKFNL